MLGDPTGASFPYATDPAPPPRTLDETDERILRLACRTFASRVLKRPPPADGEDPGTVLENVLGEVRRLFRVSKDLSSKTMSVPEPLGRAPFPLCGGSLLCGRGMGALAGDKALRLSQERVDMLIVPDSVSTLSEAALAIKQCRSVVDRMLEIAQQNSLLAGSCASFR